ncbi:MAG: PglZ domain-containing protein, partial [Deltaproteobacteria bacterium]
LIVIDGMNLWQWYAIHQELAEQEIVVNEMATLAFLPSITAWSRQALLKGSKPDLEQNNSGEERLFREYWMRKGFQNYQIGYQRFGVEKLVDMDLLASASVVALVCNDLDDLMHGAVMGDEQLLQDTQQWTGKAGLVSLIKLLKNNGYMCFITTDHGNIEASAASILPMTAKNISTSKSKRHVRFVGNEQAEQFQKENPELAVKRRDSSLYFTDNTAFIKEGKVITHGGSHVLELIIPLGVIE